MGWAPAPQQRGAVALLFPRIVCQKALRVSFVLCRDWRALWLKSMEKNGSFKDTRLKFNIGPEKLPSQ